MEQTTAQFLDSLLTRIGLYNLREDELKLVHRDKAGYILGKMTRKRFRRKVWENTRLALQQRIAISLSEDRPIHFVVPFGGYKHFWNPSHPGPDWAELIHFRHITEYVLPILAVHKPGVVLEYISEDMILPLMNNYPDDALETYSHNFKQLIRWYSQFKPSNLDIKFFRVGDHYDKAAIIAEVQKLLPERRLAFNKLNDEEQTAELHRSNRSVFWGGREDLTGLSASEKHRRVIESRLIELAYYDTEAKPEYLGDYYTAGNHIDTWFSAGLSADNVDHSLTLSSSPGSAVDFWIGRGVLLKHGDKLMPTTISQNQYAAVKDSVNLVRIPTDFVPLSNFDAIEILSGR